MDNTSAGPETHKENHPEQYIPEVSKEAISVVCLSVSNVQQATVNCLKIFKGVCYKLEVLYKGCSIKTTTFALV